MPNSAWVVYQPLIVGLGAVVMGTIGNTLLEWYRNYLKNVSTSTSVRYAIIEELRQARETAVANMERSEAVEDGSSLIIPLPERYPIYETNIAAIGTLRPAEISLVLRSYGMLQARVETLSAIGSLHRNEGKVLFAIVDAKWGNVLADNNRQLAETLRKAISELENGR